MAEATGQKSFIGLTHKQYYFIEIWSPSKISGLKVTVLTSFDHL